MLVTSGDALIPPSNEENFMLELINDEIHTYTLNVFTDNQIDLQQSIIFDNNMVIGDLNGDYIVNILDILIMVNIIMGSLNDPGNADINDDNLINILDIVVLVNIILED
jgi:hypothetical protein